MARMHRSRRSPEADLAPLSFGSRCGHRLCASTSRRIVAAGADVGQGVRLLARRGFFISVASRANRSGLTVGSGSRVSNQSARSSARSTFTSVLTVDPLPASRLISEAPWV